MSVKRPSLIQWHADKPSAGESACQSGAGDQTEIGEGLAFTFCSNMPEASEVWSDNLICCRLCAKMLHPYSGFVLRSQQKSPEVTPLNTMAFYLKLECSRARRNQTQTDGSFFLSLSQKGLLGE